MAHSYALPGLPASAPTPPNPYYLSLGMDEEALAAAVADLKVPATPPVTLGAGPDALAQEALKKSAMGKEFRTNLGIAGLIGGAQFAAQVIPTAQDKYNRERLAELKATRGELPAPVEEQFKAAEAGLRQASAQRAQQAAALQTSLGHTSAAAQLRPGRETARQDIAAAVQLGAVKAAAAAKNLEAQLNEIDQRTAYLGQRQAAVIGAGKDIAVELAKAVAKERAGRLTSGLDLSSLQGIEDPVARAKVAEIIYNAKTPAEQEALLQLLGWAPA